MTTQFDTDGNIHSRAANLSLAIERTEAWLRSQPESLFVGAAARVHAAALASVCASGGGVHTAHNLFAEFHRRIEPEDLAQVDPLTASLSSARPKAPQHPSTAFETTASASISSAVTSELAEFLAGGPPGARQAVAAIEIDSYWGTQEIRGANPCSELLQGVALAAARSFNFIFALRSARASIYCGRVSPAFTQTFVDFIHHAQGTDGAFLSSNGVVPESRACPELAFIVRCAASTQALWTLKEFTEPGFRLMNAVRGLR